MTEQERRARGPTHKDIQSAIESLAQVYHEMHQANTSRDRYLRERLDAIMGTLERMQAQIDRRFDQVWVEVDALKARVDRLEAGGDGR